MDRINDERQQEVKAAHEANLMDEVEDRGDRIRRLSNRLQMCGAAVFGLTLMLIATASWYYAEKDQYEHEADFVSRSQLALRAKHANPVDEKLLHDYCYGVYPSRYADLHADICWAGEKAQRVREVGESVWLDNLHIRTANGSVYFWTGTNWVPEGETK